MGRVPDPLLTDLDRLTAPISVERPCGEWLRYEGAYEQVRDARREDDASLPQGVWQSDLKRANWAAVEQLCSDALANKTKDLQLAGWLLEAWIQLDSFAGAARGIELMRRLCLAYWDGMYPAMNGDMTARLSPIQWVNDKLSRRLRLLRVTHPTMEGVPAYSLADWDVALRNPGGASTSSTVTLATFEQSVHLTSYRWFQALAADVSDTIARVRVFDNLLDEKAGKQAPGLIKFRSEATSIEQLLETMLAASQVDVPEAEESALAPSAVEAIADQPMALPASVPSSTPGHAANGSPPFRLAGAGIQSRAEAYRLLEEVADYLYENDPHSPTPYLIRRAVSWGAMHFEELIPELVRDRGELSDILKLLQIDQPIHEKE